MFSDPLPLPAVVIDAPIDRCQPVTGESLEPKTLTILGAGAWGSALAQLAVGNGHAVRLWSRRQEAAGGLSLAAAIAGTEIVLSAISMQGVAETIARLRGLGLPPGVILVSATKGLDAQRLQTPSQLWQEAFPQQPFVVLSGPNLSEEIRLGLPTATVVACAEAAPAAVVQRVFACDRFRVYTNADPLGTELGGTLKNVVAIAVGVCDGLDLGTNAKSALITRALVEMIRVGTHLGGRPETFCGLSGLGDLLATCTSPLSRNYRVGYGLAQGKPLEQILVEIQSTAEGVNTAQVLHTIAQNQGIAMPIAKLVYLVLGGQITPQQAVEALMERDLKAEQLDVVP